MPRGRSPPKSRSSSRSNYVTGGGDSVLENHRASPEPPDEEPRCKYLNQYECRKQVVMLHQGDEGAGRREHQRNVDEIEDDDRDQQRPPAAKKCPARGAERELDQKIKNWVSLQVHAETGPPLHRQQGDVRLVVNDVQDDVRENPKPDRCAKVAASRGLAKDPGERGQQQPCADRMRVR